MRNIGKGAALADVPVATVRYYETPRLISEPPRAASGHLQHPPRPWTGCAPSSVPKRVRASTASHAAPASTRKSRRQDVRSRAVPKVLPG